MLAESHPQNPPTTRPYSRRPKRPTRVRRGETTGAPLPTATGVPPRFPPAPPFLPPPGPPEAAAAAPVLWLGTRWRQRPTTPALPRTRSCEQPRHRPRPYGRLNRLSGRGPHLRAKEMLQFDHRRCRRWSGTANVRAANQSPGVALAILGFAASFLSVWAIASLLPCLSMVVQFMGLKIDALGVPDNDPMDGD